MARTELTWSLEPRLRLLCVSALLLSATSGCASSPSGAPEAAAVERWQGVLLERSALSAEERVERAEDILRRDRWQRIEGLHQRTLEAAWRVALRSSPQRIWSGVRRVWRGVRRFRKPTDQEALALRWLAPGAHELEAEGAELYRKLEARERGRLAELRRSQAAASIEGLRFETAHRQLERAAELEPGSPENASLLRALEESEAEHAGREIELVLRPGEAERAARLLTGAPETEPLDAAASSAERQLVAAAGQLLAGRRDVAREQLLRLSQTSGPPAAMAEHWLERPDVDVEGELQRAVRSYRRKRLLGWIGGAALADRGTSFSSRSFGAWREAFTLTNMAVSFPARLIRGWRPDPEPVRLAARGYLEQKPQGARASQARAWLDHVGWADPDGPDRLGLGPDRLGFALPPAESIYRSLHDRPVIISRGAVFSGYVTGSSSLLSALEGMPAARLEARHLQRPATPEEELEHDGFAFTRETARRLLDEMAAGIERGQLRFSLDGSEAALERLRRLDAAIERGDTLYAEGWLPPPVGFWSTLASTALEGTEHRGSVAFERGEDDLVAVSDVGNELRGCPSDTLCVDLEHLFRTAFYGYMDMTSGAGLGFQSSSRLVGMGLGMTESGPEASLVLPLGRWLGIDGWLPLEIELSVGAAPYVGPVLRKQKCIDALESPDEASVRRLLPLGLRSRCVLRLY